MLALSLAAILAAGASDVPVVSVLYFDNESKDAELEFMRKGLADLLITDLVAWEGVKVVERTRLEDVLKELDFQQTKYVDKKTAAKLGAVLGSSHLIYGSMLMVGGKLTITSRIVSRDGTVVATVKEQDEKDKIFELEQRLANQLIAQIDSKLSPNAQARRKVKVPDLAAVVAYGKFLDLSDQGKLEEAQVAVRALVSKAPTFLLARERQQALLKAFEEYQKRKKDLLGASVIELGKRVDLAMKDEGKFDSMTLEQKQRFVLMRAYKARFLARVLKQFLSKHSNYLRLALEADEPKAVVAMRNWVENQRRLMSEVERGRRQHATVAGTVTLFADMDDGKLTPEEEALVQDAVVGERPREWDMGFMPLADFVLQGNISDGQRFRVGPVLSAVDPKEDKAIRDELDSRIKAAINKYSLGDTSAENDAISLIEFKAQVARDAMDIDVAVVAYQLALDTFPTGRRNEWIEGQIKTLLEGRGNEFHRDNEWLEALKDCDDKLNGGSLSIDRRLPRTGVRGIDQMCAEMEKSCKITNQNKTWAGYAYRQFASTAAEQDDCARARLYWRKFVEIGGQVSEVATNGKAFHPWCDLSEVTQNLTWFHLDGDLQGDFPRRPISIKSSDGTVITISANTDGPRYKALGGEEESFDLRLEKQPTGNFNCTSARWRYSDGKYYEGTCTVTIKKFAPEGAPGFDEGTYEVSFPKFPVGNTLQKRGGHGHFKVRREN